MSFFTLLGVSLRALRRNRLRSVLTMLGVIVGVATLVTVLAIASGARQAVEDRIASFGTNLLYLWPGSMNRGGVRGGRGTRDSLTIDDMAAIRRECPGLAALSPVVWTAGQVVFGNRNVNTTVVGVGHEFAYIRSWPMAQGVFFHEDDVRGGGRVCVVGSKVADELFKEGPPLDAVLRVGNVPFRVIGVLSEKGDRFWGGDHSVLIPHTTAMRQILHRTRVHCGVMSAHSIDDVDEVKRQVSVLMRQRHKLRDSDPDDFEVRTQVEWIREQEESSFIFTMLLAGVASVSLLVGGIGIMNIMLVSVTERIREIGIRLAMGARSRDVMVQFLAEAMILSVVGGLVGILAGYEFSSLAARYGSWDIVISPESIVLAFVFSVAVGVFFGFYPARKASRLDPIEALRQD